MHVRLQPLGVKVHQANPLELRFRLNVDATDAFRHRELDFGLALADAGKERLARIAARRQHARELAARHDVEARAQAREQREHR